jgi:hypothetical protein
MNSRARWSARFAIAAALFAVPCFAQDPAPADDSDGYASDNVATPDYLNPAFAASGFCAGQSQNAQNQNASQNTQQSPPAESSSASSSTPSTQAAGQDQEPPGGKRVFGVLPNYRTASSCQEGVAISPGRKIHIALKDSFDYPLILLSAAYAGFDQLTNDEPSFGQGVKGYAHRLWTNYLDQAVGNMMTEGLLPVVFKQDPRYFRRGPQYKPGYRVWYALTRVIVTDRDDGRKQFNYSEWLGNATAAAVSNIWEPDDRNAASNTYKLLEYVGTDAVSQVLKEFWPDIKHKLFHRGDPNQDCGH